MSRFCPHVSDYCRQSLIAPSARHTNRPAYFTDAVDMTLVDAYAAIVADHIRRAYERGPTHTFRHSCFIRGSDDMMMFLRRR